VKELNARLAGYVFVGALLTGVLAFFAGLVAALQLELSAAGLCFIAAALAFGLLTNAIYRT
jgi:hypothetical protein